MENSHRQMVMGVRIGYPETVHCSVPSFINQNKINSIFYTFKAINTALSKDKLFRHPNKEIEKINKKKGLTLLKMQRTTKKENVIRDLQELTVKYYFN